LFSRGSSGARHSPFTAALLNNIAVPSLDVKDVFYKVGRDVVAATGGKQRPEISISMYEQYALVPAKPEVPQQTAVVPPGAPAPSVSPSSASTKPSAESQIAAVAPPVKPVPAGDRCSEPVTVSFASRCAAPLTAAQERGLKSKDSFRECESCPEMVVVPAGSFTMGSPEGEPGRKKTEGLEDEGPQHVVTIGKPFAVGKFHVTVAQYAEFVRKTGYTASSKCYIYEENNDWKEHADRSWRNPGYSQEDSHPVVCVSRDDVNAYLDWMARETGKPYRLLSESEFEYAARGRTSPGAYPRFWFGDDEKDLCRYGNGADQKARDNIEGARIWIVSQCNDGYAYTSPVGNYEPNSFGLYDMFGNAWQWTADCYHASYAGAPADGSAWTTGCSRSARVIRGGGWFSKPRLLRSANRLGIATVDFLIGFRVARTLTP
jgi:formylglycine-generating enzyme required for sulfatase activity